MSSISAYELKNICINNYLAFNAKCEVYLHILLLQLSLHFIIINSFAFNTLSISAYDLMNIVIIVI